jgi:macrolide transport system ATP-binding/permease protein
VAVIGLTVARQLFGESNPLGEYIKINRVIFQVIGILPPKGSSGWRDEDDTILVPVTTAMYRLLGKTYADTFSVEVKDADQMDQAQADITRVLRQRLRIPASQEEPFNNRNMAAIQDALTSTTKTLSMLLAFIASISLLVGGIGIMNIMLVSVTERTREIGLRKAVGAKGKDILSQFLIEAMVIGMIGGIAGILLGWAASTTVSMASGWATEMTLSSVLMAVLFSGGTGVVFGFWPAKKAAKLNPIEALRYE